MEMVILDHRSNFQLCQSNIASLHEKCYIRIINESNLIKSDGVEAQNKSVSYVRMTTMIIAERLFCRSENVCQCMIVGVALNKGTTLIFDYVQ